MVADTERGRHGVRWRAGASAAVRVEDKGVAKCCSPLKDEDDELAGEEEAVVARISDVGDSGGTPVEDRGVAPESIEGVNLRQEKLTGRRCNSREKERERGLSSSLAT
jgi:hypothetical protein